MCYSIDRKRGDCMCGNECCNVDAPDLRHDAPLLLLDEYGWLSGSPCMGCYVEEEGSVDKTERELHRILILCCVRQEVAIRLR